MTLLKDILRLQLLQDNQLSLVTSVLGASASWYAHSLIAEATTAGNTVCLISFTHDRTFHHDCVRKMGVDLAQYTKQGQYTFIDGFSALFFAAPVTQTVVEDPRSLSLAHGTLKSLSTEIQTCIRSIEAESKILLVLEHPELLLASAGITAVELVDAILDWHAMASSTAVIVSADSALIARNLTRIESEHSAFVTTLVHEAATTVSLRMLDTGLAKDVSGVLRITRNWFNGSGIEGQTDMEALYLVKDNSVDVFGRGEQRG